MEASNFSNQPQPEELLGRFTDDAAQSTCNLPAFFKTLPGELQDQILTDVFCAFPRPETSDPANNGKYIGEHSGLGMMPWKIDTKILGHPDPEVRGRARRVILTKNQFIYIKSESVNLLPIFHAAQVPIVAKGVGTWAKCGLKELSEFFILTHQIERLGGIISSRTSTPKPWGRTRQSLEALGLTDRHAPQLQEFVILRRDLTHFCRALDGADSGYHQFGACTRHTLTVNGPFEDIPTEDIPVLHPSSFLQPYQDILRGFPNFTIQGRTSPDLARDIETEVKGQIATPQPKDILEDVSRQMKQGDEHLYLNRPNQAAHTYARASQGLVWLYSKGLLPHKADSSPHPELAELFFVLNLRQAAAWLTVMQKKRKDGEGATRNRSDDTNSRSAQLEEGYSSLVDLVYSTIVHQIPPPLQHKPSLYQSAIQLYHAVKADRLGDCGTILTWTNINNALRMAPHDNEIRREAELIHRRMTPWTLRWIPE